MMPTCRTSRLTLMTLEERLVPSTLELRSYDGSNNNLSNPEWGMAGINFLRIAPAEYADGIAEPAGEDRPSARAISNAVSAQAEETISNDRMLSALVYAWGQFIDHDLDLTLESHDESFPVIVPTGDPTFDPNGTGSQTLSFSRSGYDPETGNSLDNPREQVNLITAWLDGSMIYGSDEATAESLRTFEGGRLKTSEGDLLPMDQAGFFLAGDVRANENPELTSLHTLFVREHNRVAGEIAAANPDLDDEAIFQQARAWVIAELQAITYNEWLPALLGTGTLGPYQGYDPGVNPGIANEFATAGFRVGHSLLGDSIEFLGDDGQPVAEAVSLAEAFFNPSLVSEYGIDALLKNLASDLTSEVDTRVVDSLRNLLIPTPGQTVTLDLVSLNIQRGRDHGLADYNTVRAAYGLPAVHDFADITSDPELQDALRSLYSRVDNIDLWVGALAEDHLPGSSVGPTVRAIIADQFDRIRAGDRFWYENIYSGADLRTLRNTSLSDIIERNTELTSIQDNPFFFEAEIRGVVRQDNKPNGRREPRGPGRNQEERVVQLVDLSSGEVVAEQSLNTDGRFRFTAFDGLRTGEYTIRVVFDTQDDPVMESEPVLVNSGDTQTWIALGDGDGDRSGSRPPRRQESMVGRQESGCENDGSGQFLSVDLNGVGPRRMRP